MMKLLTQAVEINVFTSDLVQIYRDVHAAVTNPFTDEERQGIIDKLVDFKLDIAMKHTKNPTIIRELNLPKSPNLEPKTLIRDSRYRIPPETAFKRYKSKPLEDSKQSRFLAQNDGEINMITERASGIDGHDVLFARIAFSVNSASFEKM